MVSRFNFFVRELQQSTLVNDQLSMLYSELNFDGGTSGGHALNLEEGMTSSCSSGDENGKDNDEIGKVVVFLSFGYCNTTYLLGCWLTTL